MPAVKIITLADVKTWVYNIQNVNSAANMAALGSSHYDLYVIEPTRSDKATPSFDCAQLITDIKAYCIANYNKEPLVLAYIDMGQAEEWRWYFDSAWTIGNPTWIVANDPNGWAGNFPVAYWRQEWHDIVYAGYNGTSMVDQTTADGFDGIYMDWVEAFSDTNVVTAAANDSVNPASEMFRLIEAIRDHARLTNPDYLIVAQNAPDLYPTDPTRYIAVMDAIAEEAVWYEGSGGFDTWGDPAGYNVVTNSMYPGWTETVVGHLDNIKQHMPVFCVEYAQDIGGVNLGSEVYNTLAPGKGYIPYCTQRSLAELSTTPVAPLYLSESVYSGEDDAATGIPLPAMPARVIPSPALVSDQGVSSLSSTAEWGFNAKMIYTANHFGAGKGAIRVVEDHVNLNWCSTYNLADGILNDKYYTIEWKQSADSSTPLSIGLEFVRQAGGGYPRVHGGVYCTEGTGVQTFYAVIKFNSKHFGSSSSTRLGVEIRNHPIETRVSINQTDTGSGNAYVGDFKIYQGKHVPAAVRSTQSFGGANGRIRISETGAWTIDGIDAFPMFVYGYSWLTSTTNQNYASLNAHGFNGINNDGFLIGSTSETNLAAINDNDMWLAYQLRSVLSIGGGELTKLQNNLQNFVNNGVFNRIKMFSIDNEMLTKQFPYWDATKSIIDSFDPNGEIPFVMLDGAIGMGDNYPTSVPIAQTGAYNDYIDYGSTSVWCYNSIAESRTEVSLGMAFSGNHDATGGLIQINCGSDVGGSPSLGANTGLGLFASMLFGGIATGGTHMQHWADQPASSEGFPTEMGAKIWYSNMATYRAHVDLMVDKGLIHGQTHTNFTLDSENALFAFGTKIAADNLAYIIIAANTTDAHTFTSGISGLHYIPSGNLIDIFTETTVATLSGDAFSIALGGNDYKVLVVEPDSQYDRSIVGGTTGGSTGGDNPVVTVPELFPYKKDLVYIATSTGNIFFADINAATNGVGTEASPFNDILSNITKYNYDGSVASAGTVQAGDTLLLKSGSYGDLLFNSYWTDPYLPITIKSQAGEHATFSRVEFNASRGFNIHDSEINGNGLQGFAYLVYLRSSSFFGHYTSNIHFKNVYVRSFTDDTATLSVADWLAKEQEGIFTDNIHHCLIEDVFIENVRFGIKNGTKNFIDPDISVISNSVKGCVVNAFTEDAIRLETDCYYQDNIVRNAFKVDVARHNDGAQYGPDIHDSTTNGFIAIGNDGSVPEAFQIPLQGHFGSDKQYNCYITNVCSDIDSAHGVSIADCYNMVIEHCSVAVGGSNLSHFLVDTKDDNLGPGYFDNDLIQNVVIRNCDGESFLDNTLDGSDVTLTNNTVATDNSLFLSRLSAVYGTIITHYTATHAFSGLPRLTTEYRVAKGLTTKETITTVSTEDEATDTTTTVETNEIGGTTQVTKIKTSTGETLSTTLNVKISQNFHPNYQIKTAISTDTYLLCTDGTHTFKIKASNINVGSGVGGLIG